jgi:hypothetical protein
MGIRQSTGDILKCPNSWAFSAVGIHVFLGPYIKIVIISVIELDIETPIMSLGQVMETSGLGA